jgi:hypothetical protein
MAWPGMNPDEFSYYVGSDFGGFPYPVPVDVDMKQLYLSMIKNPFDMVVIDLSDNRFSGSIPKTIGNLVALHVLNMSHNALSVRR